MHVSLDTATDQLSEIWILPPYETPLYQLRMDVGDIHEVQIPTCSYRMGTPHMGYGLAYIGIELNFLGCQQVFTCICMYCRYSREDRRVHDFMVTRQISAAMCLYIYCYTGHCTCHLFFRLRLLCEKLCNLQSYTFRIE